MKWIITLILIMALSDIPYATASWTAPSSDLTDYVGYVDLSDLPQSWWDEWDTDDATKMRVAKDDASEGSTSATELAFDPQEVDRANQNGRVWLIWSGTLPATSPDDVRVYPAKSSATSYGVTATFGSQAVWANFWRVSHDGGASDATGNGNGGTLTGTSSVAGKVGDATDYGSTGDQVDGATDLDLTSSFTVYGWVSFDDVSNDEKALGFEDSVDSDNLLIGSRSSNLKLFSNGETPSQGSTTLTNATFYQTGFRFTTGGSDLDIILDGAIEYSSSFSGTGWQTCDRIRSRYWSNGNIQDEIRYIQDVLSVDYLSHEHSNQNDPAGFWGTWTLVNTGGGGETPTFRAQFILS